MAIPHVDESLFINGEWRRAGYRESGIGGEDGKWGLRR
jgi:hypothetical protein